MAKVLVGATGSCCWMTSIRLINQAQLIGYCLGLVVIYSIVPTLSCLLYCLLSYANLWHAVRMQSTVVMLQKRESHSLAKLFRPLKIVNNSK